QACVSACPTGSLIEINAYDLFHERSPGMVELARAGYAADRAKRHGRREMLPITPFTDGVDIRSGGLAKVKRGRYAPLVLWMFGLVAFLVAVAEILLRLYAPTLSYQYTVLKALPDFAGVAEEAVLDKVTYRAGPGLSVYCGVIGSALMVFAAIY